MDFIPDKNQDDHVEHIYRQKTDKRILKKNPWRDYRLHGTVLILVIIAELIGTIKIPLTKDVAITIMPLIYTIILGLVFYLAKPIKWIQRKQARIAEGAMMLFIGVLIAKFKLPAFIATLGTMMVSRGLSALFTGVPNIFYPTGLWFNKVFSNFNGFPVGLLWVFVLMLICMYLMYKNKIGRYILAIGSNEEATRLSGINTDKYKIYAYVITGFFAGVAGVLWSASFVTVASATGNGMELDAIAGVYIGGTSATGGVASVGGSVIGALMLVVIRSGLNFVLSLLNISVNSTYVTYVLTGVIVVASVLIDVLKVKGNNKIKKNKLKGS